MNPYICTCGAPPTVGQRSGSTAWTVRCTQCGRRTFMFVSRAAAVDNWNKGNAWTVEQREAAHREAVERMLSQEVRAERDGRWITIREGCTAISMYPQEAKELAERMKELAEDMMA